MHDRAWEKVTVQRSTKGSLSLHNIAAFRGERERELLAQKLSPRKTYVPIDPLFGWVREGAFGSKASSRKIKNFLKKGLTNRWFRV